MNNNDDDTKKIIYRYDDYISFRKCDLADNNDSLTFGDCTNFGQKEKNWQNYYYCNQHGIHLHCTKHPEIELKRDGLLYLKCPKCGDSFHTEKFTDIINGCLQLLNIKKFEKAKYIRLDDWYTPEIKCEVPVESDYWIKADVKTDKDKDTMIVLYVGKKDSREKSQFYIKPEKLQLSSDYKDLDPATIISKIEVTLKDRTIKQEYDNKSDD